ncbi:hypothetical protein L810_0758 [Burkholderia sp. AU4i]|nr:hypothetical protein L810_0758 [Burkholderia sp. AU4i]
MRWFAPVATAISERRWHGELRISGVFPALGDSIHLALNL